MEISWRELIHISLVVFKNSSNENVKQCHRVKQPIDTRYILKSSVIIIWSKIVLYIFKKLLLLDFLTSASKAPVNKALLLNNVMHVCGLIKSNKSFKLWITCQNQSTSPIVRNHPLDWKCQIKIRWIPRYLDLIILKLI